MLVEKGRIALDRDPFVWCADLLDDVRMEVAPLTPTVALAAAFLSRDGFTGDSADAMLYATARELDVPLVSKDHRIRDHARSARDLRVVW
jgi:PIN domain nuclease of toxin-antitoxin system